MLTWPVTLVGWVTSIVKQAEASQKRINEFLDSKSSLKNGNLKMTKNQTKDIIFKNVSFEYDQTGIKIFNSFNLKIEEDKSLINRLGFNNKGLEVIKKNLRKKRDVIIGANIGKNVFTENKDGHKDYLKCLDGLHDSVDYFAINISSPNTKNLRQFHSKELLKPLLENLINYNNNKPSKKPMLLKISPDLEKNELDDIISLVSELNIFA